jgi:hypothetical protein
MDRHIAGGHVGKQNALIFLCALSDKPFSHRY